MAARSVRDEDGIRAERGAWAIVVMGEFAGAVSPASAYTPIVGAEVRVAPGARVRLPLKPEWEYALLSVDGDISAHADAAASANVDAAASGPSWRRGELLYLGIARDHIEVTSADGATLFVLGGEPFPDDIVMWWNFVGRDHDEIVEAREEWEARSSRFGQVVDHGDERIPAPPLPGVRLTPRRTPRVGGGIPPRRTRGHADRHEEGAPGSPGAPSSHCSAGQRRTMNPERPVDPSTVSLPE